MATPKQELEKFLESQPVDFSKEELFKELAFELMVQRGLADSDAGRTISNAELTQRVAAWKPQ